MSRHVVSARARLLCSNILVESDVWREDRCGDKGREEEERKRKKPKVNEKKKTKVEEKKKEGDNEEKEEEDKVKGDGLVTCLVVFLQLPPLLVVLCLARLENHFFIGAGGGGNALVSPLTLIGPVASVAAVLAFGQSTLDCELYTIFSQLRPGYPPIHSAALVCLAGTKPPTSLLHFSVGTLPPLHHPQLF